MRIGNWRCSIIPVLVPALFLFLLASVANSSTLEIVEPVPMETLETSNVWITIQLNFTTEEDFDPATFRATINGKPVESLFEYTEEGVIEGLISAADGVNASVEGPRMNVFMAEAAGADGKKEKQMTQFLVDCSGNSPPVAMANLEGVPRVVPGETLVFDGSGSMDEDEDPLTYRWFIVSAPRGSQAKLSDRSVAAPIFVPDVPGEYTVELIASDHKEESEPAILSITADELSILIDRPIRNPVFDLLSEYAVVEQYDGTQNPADFRLVVLDAENQDPEALYDNPLVVEAFAAGTWVLALNVTEEQKQKGFVRHLGLASGEESVAFMFRRQIAGDGTPYIRIKDLPLLVLPLVPPKVDPEDYLWYADTILKTLKPGRMAGLPDNPIPEGLLSMRWEYSVAVPWTMTWSGRHPTADGRIQQGSHNVNYIFTLFLDNANNWQGNKQYLLLQIDGQGNPRIPGSDFMATLEDRNKKNEFGWMQDQLTVQIVPQDSFWIWLANSPISVNPEFQYTSNSSFTLSFNPTSGPTASYTAGSTVTSTITSWGVACNTAGSSMSWSFYSQKPMFGRYFDAGEWFYIIADKPKDPLAFPEPNNRRTHEQADYHASAAWRTDTLISQNANFNVSGTQHIVNTYCGWDWGTTVCGVPAAYYQRTIGFQKMFSVDLGAIIPIEIAAITFDQYPVLVGPLGRIVKGTIILEEPAKSDIQIVAIRSSSENAAPKNTNTLIKSGQKMGNFIIDVNPKDAPIDSIFFASISAFYAREYNQQLAMRAVDPVTSPVSGPVWSGKYGGFPMLPNWVDGFLVRYAVSYVYPGNKESAMGPWSDWIGPGVANAMPLLEGIPTDPSGSAVARKIYRQFFANYVSADPSLGVALITTLNDNTTTTYLDNNP